MAQPKVRVKVEGLKALRERLTDPTLIEAPLKEMLTEAAQIGRDAAAEAIDGGLGRAVRSLNQWINPTFSRVTSAMPKARVKSIDKGRKPGENVPQGQIANWLRGSVSARRGDVPVEKVRRVQKRIREHGTPGKEFNKAAREAVAREMPRLRAGLEAKIARHFRRGA